MSGTSKKNKHRSPQQWLELKRKFIELSLDGEPMTLQQFADLEDIPLGTIRNRAAKENWLHDLEERLDLKHTKELASVKKAHERSMMRLRSMAVNEEVSVRSRHAAHGRALQKIAYDYFNDHLKPEELRPTEAVQVMRLGIDIEKSALGLVERLEPNHPLTNPNDMIDQMARTSLKTDDVDEILADVLEAIWKGRADNQGMTEEEQEVELSPVEAS